MKNTFTIYFRVQGVGKATYHPTDHPIVVQALSALTWSPATASYWSLTATLSPADSSQYGNLSSVQKLSVVQLSSGMAYRTSTTYPIISLTLFFFPSSLPPFQPP